MFDRIVRAIKLDPLFYREVAANPAYMSESVIIVVAVAIISSLGVLFDNQQGGMAFIIQVLNNLLLGWVLWAIVAYFVGTGLFHGRSSINEMLRVLGYANAPRLLGLFSFIPCFGWIIALAGWILSLAAGVIAIRESMEFDTGDAIITAVLGLLLYIAVSIAVGILFAIVALPFR